MKVYNIVDSFDGEPDIKDLKSGPIAVLTSDGKRLYDITLNDDGSLDITTNDTILLNGKILDTSISVRPRFSNSVIIERPEYKR